MLPTDLPADDCSSSSNSTTPPSETTLTDDVIDFESSELGNYLDERGHKHKHSNLKQQQQQQQENSKIEQQQQHQQSSSSQQSQAMTRQSYAIHTDYESSAAEESYLFTLGKYENAESALLSYSRTNKLEKLQSLLEAKFKNEINLNLNFKGQQKQNFSWSALHLACYFGHIQVVEQLLSRKQFRGEIDINIKNNSGDTPLHKATLTNRVQIVQLLLSNGANLFVKNCDGLFAKQLTSDKHILEMLEGAEQTDKNLIKQSMFKAVDNGDLKKLQEYFQNYDVLNDPAYEPNGTIHSDQLANVGLDQAPTGDNIHQSGPKCDSLPSVDYISQMSDERGNTLLHLAAMRGFKAICIYLLEHGFDPYRKNNLGQTCIDISSYQLRQLFMSVKPASNQLKRLSKERVTRFEGPLMKRVRILGWKQIYVVLENGVILLFNNRKDSMNRSRRGYKYLESASCEPDLNDVGLFNITFSDRSRATFLVSSDHISQYASFKSTTSQAVAAGQDNLSKNVACNQIELVRQKWVDCIRDHIVYSTEFIRKGLKFNDDDDEDDNRLDGDNINDISSLNHLLPMDTIKSFFQEARAHYSIQERHAESLCNLIQSLNNSGNNYHNSLANSMEASQRKQADVGVGVESGQQNVTSSMGSNSGGGNRLFGFIRGSTRQTRTPSGDGGDDFTQMSNSTVTSGGGGGSSSVRVMRNNNNLTNEFLQDNWPCLLFHLRLLMESTQNTKTTLGQALALMEHQEQLRQNRLQDQDERCRVLEDSLHALARDHHELEKSLSMSQIYQSATACRSISMSTDLNEYFDAFEDFDDEKTMTPDSSPDDNDGNKGERGIHQWMINGANEGTSSGAGGVRDARIVQAYQQQQASTSSGRDLVRYGGAGDNLVEEDYDEEEEELEDDLQSNCSALTVETITDQYLSAAADTNHQTAGAHYESQRALTLCPSSSRTRLPAPMVPRDQVSIWSILKNCIGKELSKITMPVVFNEPLTMLQRAAEGIQYCHYIKMADESEDPIERMELVCAFIVASISCNCHRIIKPFNPLLYETYDYEHKLEDGSIIRSVAQQVSHHPPITAVCCESDRFVFNGVINPKIKFWGRSIEVSHDGSCRIYLKRHNETYLFNSVACSVHNIIVGKLWFEHHGPLDIKCHETNLQANLTFKQAGWFSNELHRFEGFIVSGMESISRTTSENKNKKLRYLYGKWTDYIKSVNYSDYENFMRDNQQKLFKIPDEPDGQWSNGLSSKLANVNLDGTQNSINNNNNNNSIPSGSSSRPTLESTTTSSSAANKLRQQQQQQPPPPPNVKSFLKGGDRKQTAAAAGGGGGGYTKSESTQSLDIPNSRTLWRLEAQYLSEYYNFTLFTMKLNEMTPELEKTLPRSDSRFRPDVKRLEDGDLDGAASEKQRLEEKQREARARDKRFKDPSADFLWFEQCNVPNTKEKYWLYKGGYWENKCNPSKFPDLF